MNDGSPFWPVTISVAALAVGTAAVGLAIDALGFAPLASTSLLVASLMFTGGAFTRLAMRVRRIELENEGLVEELSQEFGRVKDRLDGVSEALGSRVLAPAEDEATVRRIVVK